jgi:PAT family beta-lactamase induction signal transducer AmpG
MTRRPTNLFWLFGVVYFVQGVIQAYQINFFKPHMNSEGIDADRIAVVASIAVLPFILKSLLGLVSDRVALFGWGHRKPYMVLGLAGCIAVFAVAFFLDPSTDFALFGGLVITMTFLLALFDTTADAYAVEVIPTEQQATVQGFMTGGRALGLILLSLVFGQIADRSSYAAIFPVIAVLLMVPLAMVWRLDTDERVGPARGDLASEAAGLGADDKIGPQSFQWSAFARFATARNLAFSGAVIGAWLFFQGIDGLITFYMQDQLGISDTGIGNFGSLKGVGMVAGAAATAYLVPRLGPMGTTALTLALVSAGGWLLSSLSTLTPLLVVAAVWGVVVGLHWTVYATVSMRLTDVRIAATMFALFQTMANIGLAAGDGIATSLSDDRGFVSVFRLLAVGNLLALPLIALCVGWASRSGTVAATVPDAESEAATA